MFTILGELVWSAVASAAGTAFWNGHTTRGHAAASGTYLAVIEGAGARAVRRVVLIR